MKRITRCFPAFAVCILLWWFGGYHAAADATTATGGETAATTAAPPPVMEWPDGGELDPGDSLSGIPQAGGFGIDLIQRFLIRGSGDFLFLNGTRIVTALYPIGMVVGLLVLMVSWCMHTGRKAMELELYEGKAFLKASLPLLGGMLFMPVSYGLLQLVSLLCDGLSRALVGSTQVNIAAQLQQYAESYDRFRSKVPIVGGFIQHFNYLSAQMPLLLMNLLFLILSIFVAVTIGIRVVKLAIYQGTAPIFIGLGAGEDTKPYMRNFFAMYIQTAAQLPIIAILMGTFQIAFTGYLNDVMAFSWQSMFSGAVIMLVLAIMVVKSDKLFARVFH